MIRDRIDALLKDNRFFLWRRLTVYLGLVLVCYLVLYWRYPNNIDYANFYAEDGSVFLQNIIDKGWLEATLTPFNGYGVIGLYLIAALGWIINLLFLGGGFENLSTSFAMASVLFMSLAICLPYLLFSATFGKPKMLTVIMLSVFLPLPTSPHVVIGTIGNQKWIFLYIAFLFVLYRVINHRRLNKLQLGIVDGVLLISAYTNSAVYALTPLLLFPYIVDYISHKKRPRILTYAKRQLKLAQTRSLLLLAALLLPQVVYVAVNGLPELQGYLDTPFLPERAIELFVNRTYLFGLTHLVNGYLNDLVVVLMFTPIVFFGWKWLSGKKRLVFFAGLYTAGVATLLFVLNRPGVTDHVFGYAASGSGPDQFFYAQTLVMYLPFVLLMSELARRIPSRLGAKISVVIITGLLLTAGIMSSAYFGERWRNASVFENDAGIYTDNALKSCQSLSENSRVGVTVYPYATGQFTLHAHRTVVCNNHLLTRYRDSYEDLQLSLNNNDHVVITNDEILAQTFIASESELNGIRLFISNFGNLVRRGNYKLIVLDATCANKVRESSIPIQLLDNNYFNARFDKINDSAKKMYCLKIEVPDEPFAKIALQLSKPGVYQQGELKLRGVIDSKDLVFGLLYDKQK